MLAVTVACPWGWAFRHLGKDLENRTWRPPETLSKQRFAIHAGKAPTTAKQAAAFDVANSFAWMREVGVLSVPAPTLAELTAESSAVVATARFERVVLASYSPWFVGPIGWQLADVFVLPKPVPCKGAQGLWTLPPDVLARVLQQEATHAR